MIQGIEIGGELSFRYPRNTHVKLFDSVTADQRRVLIRGVRDMVQQPLTVAEFIRRPFVARSRYMIYAFEPDRRLFRQFYLGTSPDFLAPGIVRLGDRRPLGRGRMQLLSRGYEPSVVDRQAFLRLLQTWPEHQLRQLSVLVDDFRFHD
jgi:hypothetical protein